MRILYGIQGTGNGHLSRSRILARLLKEAGHDVHVLISGRDPAKLPGLPELEPIVTRDGFTFVTQKGRIQLIKTAQGLSPLRFLKDIREQDKELPEVDLVISDFEPITARLAGRRSLPSLGIGHQYAFSHDVPVPPFEWMGRTILRNFAPCDVPIGLHWSSFGQPVLPPIVPMLKPAEIIDPELILVYLPFESRESVKLALEGLDGERCRIYGNVESQKADGHLEWMPFSREGFLEDLKRCRGVICNAGFELPSEALHLGKMLLCKPLKGQVEQTANGLALEKLGLATVTTGLNSQIVSQWLERPLQHSCTWPNVAAHLAEWISDNRREALPDLVRRVWLESGFNGQPLDR